MSCNNETIKNLSLNDECFVDCIIKIIEKLSILNNKNRLSSMYNKFKFLHINIELSKDKNFNWIQLTNCGEIHNSQCLTIIQFVKKLIYKVLNCHINEKIAFIYWKNAKDNYEIIYDLSKLNDDPISVTDIIQFSYLKQYLSLKMKHKLTGNDIEIFNNSLIPRLLHLSNQYPNIKYTFYAINGKLLYTNIVELDYIYTHCQLLSSSITRIIQLSLNNEFREKCFELLNIDHSEMSSDVIMSTLLSLFHDNYQT